MNWGKSFDVFWKIFTEQGGYKVFLKGLQTTMLIAVLGLLIGIAVGTVIATVKVLPTYKKTVRFLQKICDFYIAAFRGTPIVVQLLLAYYVIPDIIGVNWSNVNVCIAIFGLNSGAYVSEIMRSGILSVDPGQMEAGRALGLSYAVTMIKIVVPQAIKNILPTLGNEFISLIKETSIVSFVGATDICKSFREIGDATYEYVVPYLFMAIVYVIIVLILTLLIKLLEAWLRRSEK
ncbi:MAG: amino acid ABC transporter permease [Eubacteriales bacterium]